MRRRAIIGIAGTLLLAAFGVLALSYSRLVADVQPQTLSLRGSNKSGLVRLLKVSALHSEVMAISDYTLKPLSGGELVKIVPSSEGYLLTSLGKTGEAKLEITYGESKIPVKISIVAPEGDADKDGYPDVAELTSEGDRQAFANWFAAIAESQYVAKSFDFYPKNQDCAGLLRYSYVEALKKHDKAWHKEHKIRARLIGPDVTAFNYPSVPELGTNLFLQGDSAHTFGPFADAETLMKHNTKFLGYEPESLANGDLLFYERPPDETAGSWHSMIYLAPEQYDEAYVVYHTGPRGTNIPDGSGEVRKVLFSELMNHPDMSWHPVKNNQYFRGFYRWKLVY